MIALIGSNNFKIQSLRIVILLILNIVLLAVNSCKKNIKAERQLEFLRCIQGGAC